MAIPGKGELFSPKGKIPPLTFVGRERKRRMT
jgi:hypothetical protein